MYHNDEILTGWKEVMTAEEFEAKQRKADTGESVEFTPYEETVTLDPEALHKLVLPTYAVWHANPYKPTKPAEPSYWESSEKGELYLECLESSTIASLKNRRNDYDLCVHGIADMRSIKQSGVTAKDVREFRQELDKIIERKEDLEAKKVNALLDKYTATEEAAVNYGDKVLDEMAAITESDYTATRDLVCKIEKKLHRLGFTYDAELLWNLGLAGVRLYTGAEDANVFNRLRDCYAIKLSYDSKVSLYRKLEGNETELSIDDFIKGG